MFDGSAFFRHSSLLSASALLFFRPDYDLTLFPTEVILQIHLNAPPPPPKDDFIMYNTKYPVPLPQE
jgi:hypothetical protein